MQLRRYPFVNDGAFNQFGKQTTSFRQ